MRQDLVVFVFCIIVNFMLIYFYMRRARQINETLQRIIGIIEKQGNQIIEVQLDLAQLYEEKNRNNVQH